MEMQIRNRAAGDLLMGVGFEYVEGWWLVRVSGTLKTGRAQANDAGLTGFYGSHEAADFINPVFLRAPKASAPSCLCEMN